jgi:tetratricopeptide (TPR) repeat protein
MIFAILLGVVFYQPDPAMLRQLFEREVQRHPTAQAARDLGLFLARNGDPQGAHNALAQAARLDPRSLDIAFDLALVSPAGEAKSLLEKVATSSDAALSARAFETLGHLHDATGDKAAAIENYRHALALTEKANVLEALAADLDPGQSIPLLQRALAINRRELGARHPQTATTEANLAGALLNAGRADEAIRAATEAISIFEQRLGASHPRVATAATILAYSLRAKGDRAGAEKYYRRALAADREAYGDQHPQTQADAQTLADFLNERP